MRGIFPAIVVLITTTPLVAEELTSAELTLAAKKLLRNDPALTGSSINISVHEGVATLWGAVTDARLADIAEARVRQLPGIRTVRNETYEIRTDPVIDRVREFMRAIELPREPEVVIPMPVPSPPRELSLNRPQPVREPVQEPPPPSARLHTPVPKSKPPPPRPIRPVEPVVQAHPKSRPMAAPVSHRPAVLGTYALIEEVRDSERRFIGVRIDFQDGVVYLDGQVRKHSDSWDLAEKISSVPGVRRVVVRNLIAPHSFVP